MRRQSSQKRLSHPEHLSQPSADLFDTTLWELNLGASTSRSPSNALPTSPMTTPGTSMSAQTSNTHLTSVEPPPAMSIAIQYTLSSSSLLNTTVANPSGRILYIVDTKPRNRYDKLFTCGLAKTSKTTISRVALAGVTEPIASVEWRILHRDVVTFRGKRPMDVDAFFPKTPKSSRRRFLDTTEGRWTWGIGKNGQPELSNSSGTVVARCLKARHVLSKGMRRIWSYSTAFATATTTPTPTTIGEGKEEEAAAEEEGIILKPSPASLLISPEGVRILDVIIIGFMIMQRDSHLIPRPRWGSISRGMRRSTSGRERTLDQFGDSISGNSRIVAIDV